MSSKSGCQADLNDWHSLMKQIFVKLHINHWIPEQITTREPQIQLDAPPAEIIRLSVSLLSQEQAHQVVNMLSVSGTVCATQTVHQLYGNTKHFTLILSIPSII